MAEPGTTARIRRRPAKFGAFIQGRLPLQRDTSPPPPPSFPHGDLRAATIGQITEAASATWPQARSRDHGRQPALQALLAALEACGGETWQDRWVNGGFDQAGHPVSRIRADRPATPALVVLFALRVITPSVSAVRGNRLLGYPGLFRTAQADPAAGPGPGCSAPPTPAANASTAGHTYGCACRRTGPRALPGTGKRAEMAVRDRRPPQQVCMNGPARRALTA